MVPLPLRVTEPLMIRYVALPEPWMLMVPVLVMAPVKFSWVLFCALMVPLLVSPVR